MSLAPGARLGPYEIQTALGAGGMGEVYRATDTNLKRAVAIKVLPASVAADAERLARFQREAEVLAALNHPNIAGIYGLDRSEGTTALVMELVEGPTLADRIAQGAVPVDEALPVAKQIAQALEAAHEQGIIHRDLKPANIKVREDGTVKVLDFGLAKVVESVGAGLQAGPGGLSQSPTITTPAMTMAGMILGTAAYMSPEQAKGRPADKRSDIWAFGCVLYEMLTGKRAFEGEDVSDTLAAVLRAEPNWAALPADLPLAIRKLTQGCIQKDRKLRIADISTALFLLSDRDALARIATTTTAPPQPLWRRAALPAGVAVAVAFVTGGSVWFAVRPTPSSVTRLQITPPSPASLTLNGNIRDIAITPDGTRVVYVGASNNALFVRALDDVDPMPLVRAPLNGPFVSPNGQWVGFSADGDLKKVAITGGPAVTVASLDSNYRGATWGPDGTIVFATAGPTGLQRIAESGGEPTVLTRPDRGRGELDHHWPEFLPGGRAVLFTIVAATRGLDEAQIAVLNLETGTQTTLIRGGSDAHYVPSGHLVYGAGGTLRAVAFDLARLAVIGTSMPIVPQVFTTSGGAIDVAVASNGTLVYVPGDRTALQRTLVWVDRQGRETIIATPPRTYDQPRVSPDATRVALHATDIWLWDLLRGGLTRLTAAQSIYPVWTPDSGQIIFGSQRVGGEVNSSGIFKVAADGTGTITRLSDKLGAPTSISPDGSRLVFSQDGGATGSDVMQLRLDGDYQPTPLVQTAFNERNGEVSPDGRWLAYEANDSGTFEVYVRPFSEGGGGPRAQVSTGGGTRPLWSRKGRELFFVAPEGALMRVGFEQGPKWTATVPTKLFEGRYFTGGGGFAARMYDNSPDGQQFLVLKEGGSESASPDSLVVVQHFDEELKRLVPTN